MEELKFDESKCVRDMTMRDWYAGMALKGILSNPTWIQALLEYPGVTIERMPATISHLAFGYADAMLRQSQKGGA